jgi:hypothetical protein
MRAAAILSTVVWATASAQTILPPEQGAALFARANLGVLKCQVERLPPVLDFSFRFHAGYTVWVPLSQYRGAGHKWTVAVRVQQELAGEPVYFASRLRLPEIPDTRVNGEAGGGYLLGEGYYRASFLLLDDRDRACRADWNIDARLGPDDRHVTMAIAPGAIEEVSLAGMRPVRAPGDAPLARLTVLLHAAPERPRLSKVQARDAVTLLGALASLLDLAPAESVRLVVFNLDQQKEIYRQEHFTPDQLEAVRQAIFDLQLGVVDYRTLLNPTGHLDLLANLVNGELNAADRSDAVVFLGPHARSNDNRTTGIGIPGPGAPKFFYVEYQRPEFIAAQTARRTARMGESDATIGDLPDASLSTGRRGMGGGTLDIPSRTTATTGGYGPYSAQTARDTIDYLVTALKGKTLVVNTPDDFAKAMRQISRGK